MAAMNILEALRVSHRTQRELSARLLADMQDATERRRVFGELKSELVAHETAEERCFYVPLFEHDATVDAARHAIAEHHQMDEMVEALEQMDGASAQWRECVHKLCNKIEHHLTEEEQKFFPQARRVLGDGQRESLGKQYEAEFLTLRVREG
jgi:hemerythrin-like domain-containing protein